MDERVSFFHVSAAGHTTATRPAVPAPPRDRPYADQVTVRTAANALRAAVTQKARSHSRKIRTGKSSEAPTRPPRRPTCDPSCSRWQARQRGFTSERRPCFARQRGEAGKFCFCV